MKKLGALSLLLLSTTPAFAASKRVVRLGAIQTKWIELDDGSRYGLGENLYQKLAGRLEQSGKFVVMLDEFEKPKGRMANLALAPDSDRLHFDFAAIPSAEFKADVQEVTFSHGSRGLRRFAGFKGIFRNRFNDGSASILNEFPARSLDIVSGWFGSTFDAIGTDPSSTITGVDTGGEGEFNVVYAGMNYRRDSFDATSRILASTMWLAENQLHKTKITITGSGFLLALGATFKGVSAEFGVVRRTALKQTFDQSLDKLAAEIETQLYSIPFRTRIEKVGKEGVILNAGRREGIKVGDVFLHRASGTTTPLRVKEVFQIGSIVSFDGAPDLASGDTVQLDEGKPAAPAARAARLAMVAAAAEPSAGSELPDNRQVGVPEEPVAKSSSIHFEMPEFHEADGSITKGLSAKSLLLPIYAFRYFQYDQAVVGNISSGPQGNLDSYAYWQWNLKNSGAIAPFAKKITGKGAVVAVIDSGVDYNHSNLGAAFKRTEVGYDFISFDYRPFDDNSHGTAIAGIIAGQGVQGKPMGLAPGARLLSYKVFDPYGQTTSAAVYGAVDQAITDGAKIIVCGWDTRRDSQSLRDAIAYAESKGVLVVAGAGDKGVNASDFPSYPAALHDHANVISVTALDKAGKLSTKTGRWANYGVGAVDIAAPGVDIDTLAPRNNYLTRSGSDLAAAHVAAAAALVLEANPTFTAAQLKRAILEGARHDAALDGAVGGGRVLDAGGALGVGVN